MQSQSSPISGETSRIRPHFSEQDQSSQSHARFFMNQIRNGEQAAMPSAYFLAPFETRRATLNLDKAIEYELKHGRKLDLTMDRKKLRRTVSNRLSAQRSRLRKARYIDEMEKKVSQLEETIVVLKERVKRLKEQLKLLKEQNEELERVLGIRINEAVHSQMMIEKNQVELSRLKAEEKDLLKHLEVSWSGLYEDVKVEIKQVEEDAAINPFQDFGG